MCVGGQEGKGQCIWTVTFVISLFNFLRTWEGAFEGILIVKNGRVYNGWA